MHRPSKTFPFLLSALLILNGCILERIFTVKNQLCDFDRNFQIEYSEGFRVTLREPVLLDDDITWLAGAEPTEQKFAGDDLVMTYNAERKSAKPGGQYDLPIQLRFVRLDGEYRLKEGYLSKNLTNILTGKLLAQIMQSVCKSEKSLVKRQIKIDIRTLDRALLPGRPEIVESLGPPNPNPAGEHTLVYDYQLKNSAAAELETTIEIKFDEADEKMLGIKVKYLRYHLDADFEKGEAVLSVDIFVDEKT